MARRLDIEDASLDCYRTVIENRHDYILVCNDMVMNCRITWRLTWTACRLSISLGKH